MYQIDEISQKTIIIDTNVLIHYSTDGFKDISGNPLRTLVDNDNSLAIPPIVGFELLYSDNREEVESKYLRLLNFIPTIDMSMEYYNNAAQLAKLYRKACDRKKVPMPDLIIGAIVSTHSGRDDESSPFLLTCDRTDFCEPIWETVSQIVVYSEDGESVVTTLYLLSYNSELENKLMEQIEN